MFRIAVLGAFPFPLPQGSQVYARDQALALREAGAEVTLICYGRGVGRPPDGLPLRRTPASLSPRSLRAGPNAGKLAADAALLATYVAAHRRQGFEVVLAHNAEAALIALAARPLLGVPVVYVAHTLLGVELSSYGPERLRRPLDGIGLTIDAAVTRGADGVIALCRAAAQKLSGSAPVAVIPPGLDPAPPPGAAEVAALCRRHGLRPGHYAIYAGNLDGYQGLSELAAAAEALPELPVVAATHAACPPRTGAMRWLRLDVAETRALTHGAALAVLPRRQPGGFPIKLLNYMEAGRPIVARGGIVDTLEHERSGWLLPSDAGPRELADAMRRLAAEPALAERLGKGARATLEARHAWPELVERTLAFTGAVLGAPRRRTLAPGTGS